MPTNANAKDAHSAIFPEPPDAPKGQVRVRSLGLVDLRAHGERQRIPALHIRLNVENTNAASPWTLAIQDQLLSFPNHAEVKPTYANSSASLPTLEVKPGESHAVDLYFAVPSQGSQPKELPEFDLKWKLHAGDQVLAGSTTFERAQRPVAASPSYAEPYPVGYGPYWWDSWSGAPAVIVTPSIRVRN